jgi:hypothetical protein
MQFIDSLSMAAPVSAAKRRPRLEAVPVANNLQIQSLPRWARPQNAEREAAAFVAGAGLALFDRILRGGPDGAEPAFAGCLRQRLALHAAACASIDAGALRDAEHLAPGGELAHTSPAGRIHRLWRLFASGAIRLDPPTLRMAAELIGLPQKIDIESMPCDLDDLRRQSRNPLAAAAQAASVVAEAMTDVHRAEAEMLELLVADIVLAQRLSWSAPVPLIATKVLDVSLRRGSDDKRPRAGDSDWREAAARAYALAAQDAYALAGELSRRSEKFLNVAPKLRAKSAGRVVDLLLADDAVSPARAAKAAALSDRAGCRLFDRLVELGAVRELSGRPSFRLYGL